MENKKIEFMKNFINDREKWFEKEKFEIKSHIQYNKKYWLNINFEK